MERRTFLALAGGAVAAIGRPSPANACIWDSDTITQEAGGAPEVIPTLAGGFARNPPKYYEMRLARVTALLEASPDELAAFDDGAVACDRLGRSDEAIEWMARKRAALKRLGISRRDARAGEPNHWYRYHANLGTFHAHRWIARPDRWKKLDDLQRGHDLIESAIEDNPDAHFGREVYQLRILAWLLTRPRMPKSEEEFAILELPTFLGVDQDAIHQSIRDSEILQRAGLGDAIPGLCGLITLGAAWNSFDVTHALALLLAIDGKHTLVDLARQRCEEIVAAGGRSLVLDAPEGEALVELLPHDLHEGPGRGDYADLRRQADAWSARREAYLLERLDRGEHPDTHPSFWAEFEGDPNRMSLEQFDLGVPSETTGCTGGCSRGSDGGGWAVGAAVGAAFVLLGARAVRRSRARAAKR